MGHDYGDQSQLPSGVGGAAGREAAVQTQLGAAYELGHEAPHVDFSGDVYRQVRSDYADTYLDWTHGAKSGGRYNAPGDPLIYTSPTTDEAHGESGAYKGMANRTLMRSQFDATVGADGRGGVADVNAAMESRGIGTGGLTVPKGLNPDPWYYRALGESPYSLSQHVGRGAANTGANAMSVPSATGGTQLDIFPQNTDPSAIKPVDRIAYDSNEAPSETVADTTAKSMPVAETATPEGPIDMPAGEGARAGSARYGAAGGGLVALGSDLYHMAKGDRNVTAARTVEDTVVGTGTGATSGVMFDAAKGMGLNEARAGGAVGGVLEGGMSLWHNADAYSTGKETAAQATANTVVDTGIGIGAGVAGAELGATIGSIIPGAGTAIGAGLGFLGGMAGSYLVHEFADDTGLAGWAKKEVGSALSGAEKPLETVWNGLGIAEHAISDGVGSAGHSIANGASHLWNWMTE